MNVTVYAQPANQKDLERSLQVFFLSVVLWMVIYALPALRDNLWERLPKDQAAHMI